MTVLVEKRILKILNIQIKNRHPINGKNLILNHLMKSLKNNLTLINLSNRNKMILEMDF